MGAVALLRLQHARVLANRLLPTRPRALPCMPNACRCVLSYRAGRWRARGGAAPPPRQTSSWRRSCWRMRRSALSTSCLWTWAATMWARCGDAAAASCAGWWVVVVGCDQERARCTLVDLAKQRGQGAAGQQGASRVGQRCAAAAAGTLPRLHVAAALLLSGSASAPLLTRTGVASGDCSC